MTNQHWQHGVHHDGSLMYTSNPLPKRGEQVTLTLRVPKDAPIKTIAVRSMPDGEGHRDFMTVARESATMNYWQTAIKLPQAVNNYRFELLTTEGLYYYNGLGIRRAQTPDIFDFKLLTDFQAPTWVKDAVFYQIFPDRFCNGDPSNDPQDGEWEYKKHKVRRRAWGERPEKWENSGSLDFFGGDLQGITQQLDYIQELGANAVYLTPIFTSQSNHRYNIDDFYAVDVHLGGNEALIELTEAMHGRGMKLILDITPNHSSDTNPWFEDARRNPDSPYADFYTFYKRPDDYLAWLGVRSLPKLNYGSEGLKQMMYAGENAVFRHWLRPPYNIDGWRLDVYNMTARQGELQLNKETGQGIRRAVKQENADAYIFGESFFDSTPHLQGDEMDATMNYEGFNIPLWRWLAGYDGKDWLPAIRDTVPMPTDAFAEQLMNYRAAMPWAIARMQFNQLGSHDTWRILSIAEGNKALAKLGVGLLMTYPGVPCVYYGDEISLEGKKDPDNRRCMVWEDSAWDKDMREHYKRFIALRKSAPALVEGGYQLLYTGQDTWAFLRESPEQRVVVIGYRGEGVAAETIPVWHGGFTDGTELTDLLSSTKVTVQNGAITLTNLTQGAVLVFEG